MQNDQRTVDLTRTTLGLLFLLGLIGGSLRILRPFLSAILWSGMPHATLAAVVIAYSVGLVDPSEAMAIRRVRTMEFRWALTACLGVMVLGTLKGIVAAIILSMAGLLRLSNDPLVDELGRKPGANVFRPRNPAHPDDEIIPGLLIVRPVGRIYFGNAENVGRKLKALILASSPRVVVLDCSAIPGLEYTALKMLVSAEERLRQAGVQLWLAALNPEALELVQNAELADRLGREGMFFTVEQAVSAFEARG